MCDYFNVMTVTRFRFICRSSGVEISQPIRNTNHRRTVPGRRTRARRHSKEHVQQNVVHVSVRRVATTHQDEIMGIRFDRRPCRIIDFSREKIHLYIIILTLGNIYIYIYCG